MTLSRLEAPSDDLAWLSSPHRKSKVAGPCRLPGCNGKVDRSAGGRQGHFHSRACARKYHARRASLVAELARLEEVLAGAGPRTVDRRTVERDAAYVRLLLTYFPDMGPA